MADSATIVAERPAAAIGRPVIEAARLVESPPAKVFEFLADLENHWQLADRAIEVLDAGQAGGRVRIRGPLGVGRTAVTTVDEVNDSELRGSAAIGRRTRGHVRWSLAERDGDTLVRLEVYADSLGPMDALLLRLGGRRWLRVVFGRILARLEERLA